MSPEQIREAIAQLDLAEKLRLVEDVWDSIAENNATLPLQDWQRQELDRRYQAYQEGKLGLHDWKSVHEDLRNRFR